VDKSAADSVEGAPLRLWVQNAHCLPWSDVEAPSEIYRCAWGLDDRSNENAAGNRLLKSCSISACSITAAPLTGAVRTPASRT